MAQQAVLGNEVFEDLWACRETVLDGECEYGSEFFVKANSFDEAEAKAWEHVKRNWIYDCEDNDDHPYTEFLNEYGWMERKGDYRGFQAEVCRQIQNLDELLHFVSYLRV